MVFNCCHNVLCCQCLAIVEFNALVKVEYPGLGIARLIGFGEIALQLAIAVDMRQMVGNVIGVDQREVVLGSAGVQRIRC